MIRNSRELLLEPAETGSRAVDVGLLVLRVMGGLSLALAHGIGKMPPQARFVRRIDEMGLPAPELMAWLSSFAELGGGLLLALGLFTRPAAALVVINFLVVTLLAHAGDPFSGREKGVLFLAFALVLLFTGPGKFSLDAKLFPRLRTPREKA